MLLLDPSSNPGLGELVAADLAAHYGTPATRRAWLREFRVRNSGDQTSGPASAGLSAGAAAPHSQPAPERSAPMPKNPRIARDSLALLIDQVVKARGWNRFKATTAVVEAHPDLQQAACDEATLESLQRRRATHIGRMHEFA